MACTLRVGSEIFGLSLGEQVCLATEDISLDDLPILEDQTELLDRVMEVYSSLQKYVLEQYQLNISVGVSAAAGKKPILPGWLVWSNMPVIRLVS